MDSVVLYHCDDEEHFKTLKVLRFLPPCEVGAALMFESDPYADEDHANGENNFSKWNDVDAVESYVKCMKTQTRLIHNYRRKLPEN